jgi:hypothetical protein
MRQAPDREQIVDALRRLKPRLVELGVEHLFLFGSIARGEAQTGSDVDLFVDHRMPGFDLFDLMTVKHTVERVLGHVADVTTRGSLHPALRPGIEGSAIAVF